MRPGHWLRKNARTIIPQRHICVATSVVDHPTLPDIQELEQAAICVGLFRKGEWRTESPIISYECGKAWDWISTCLPAKPVTWIWFLNPDQDIQALQFTREVESGLFVRKYWCFACPPFIASGRYRGASVKLLGVSNWLDRTDSELFQLFGGTVDS